MRWLQYGAILALGVSCGGSEDSGGKTPGSQSGGSATGGLTSSGGTSPNGGVSSGPTGGAPVTGSGGSMATGTGGTAAGAGPVPTGGVATGGTGSGNAGSGGTPNGGTASGGTPNGGTPNGGGETAGGSATGGSGGGKAGTLGCTGSELLCEDFEDVAEGAVPTAMPWHALDASCEFQKSSFSMGVTGALANGGSKSLKITNKHFAQCRLSAQFEAVDEFWVRAYSYWDATLDISNRETLDIDLTPGFRTADDPAVRFGYRSKAPCEQYAGPQVTIIGLAGGEATGCGSREMPKGKWFCFEAHVQQSGVLSVATYIDGEAISYQSTGKPMTATVSTESAITQKIDHIRLGIFSTGEAQGTIHIDDIAVAKTRLGCAP